MRHVEPAPVAVAAKPDVRRGHAAAIEVRDVTGGDRVARREEVLVVGVRDEHLLMAPGEQIEAAAAILLELIEDGDVPLMPIAAPVAEQPQTEVDVPIQ